ncbi:hypothetical protein BOTCAL_0078g00190 [Botryotinia calthae]|uniref:Uncharacterized protein n=1 Tax=Botryotinia calthae TaxID=38488 RepID=A0A4Y8D8M6_9HELO|nr:hypothetical protein BOTCAL_0078g00190 [Botryotinia calthae]
MTGLSQSEHSPPPSDQSNQVDQPDGPKEPSKVADDSDLDNEQVLQAIQKVAIEKLQHHRDASDQRHNVLAILTRIDERYDIILFDDTLFWQSADISRIVQNNNVVFVSGGRTGKTYEPLAEKVIDYLISRVSKPQVIDSVPQIQQQQERGFDSSNSIIEPATKRLRQGGHPDNHNTTNDQGVLCIPDQLGADNLNDQAPDSALGQFRQDVPLSLPAPSLSITVPEPTLTGHPATSHSNHISINTLLNMADCVAEPTQGRQIDDELHSSLSLNGTTHNQGGTIEEPTQESAKLGVVSRATGTHQTEAIAPNVAKMAMVDKLQRTFGDHLFTGTDTSRIRRQEKKKRCLSYTDTVRLHNPFPGMDYKLEFWLCTSVGKTISQAVISSSKNLRNILGEYIFEAMKTSNTRMEQEKKGQGEFTGAVDVLFLDGDDSDCKMEVMLNYEKGSDILKEVFI